MTTTAADLQAYVNASSPADVAYTTTVVLEAAELVKTFVGDATVPDAVLDRAVLEVGSELYHRRQAPNGIAAGAGLDVAPIRVARDPMVGAYPLLRPYVGGGFA